MISKPSLTSTGKIASWLTLVKGSIICVEFEVLNDNNRCENYVEYVLKKRNDNVG